MTCKVSETHGDILGNIDWLCNVWWQNHKNFFDIGGSSSSLNWINFALFGYEGGGAIWDASKVEGWRFSRSFNEFETVDQSERMAIWTHSEYTKFPLHGKYTLTACKRLKKH